MIQASHPSIKPLTEPRVGTLVALRLQTTLTPRMRRRFAQLPFWNVTPLDDGVRLELTDLRFGSPESPGFAGVSTIVDRMNRVRQAGFGL